MTISLWASLWLHISVNMNNGFPTIEFSVMDSLIVEYIGILQLFQVSFHSSYLSRPVICKSWNSLKLIKSGHGQWDVQITGTEEDSSQSLFMAFLMCCTFLYAIWTTQIGTRTQFLTIQLTLPLHIKIHKMTTGKRIEKSNTKAIPLFFHMFHCFHTLMDRSLISICHKWIIGSGKAFSFSDLWINKLHGHGFTLHAANCYLWMQCQRSKANDKCL